MSKPTQARPLDKYEFYLSIHKFPIYTTRDAWVKVLYELREGDIEWMFQDFMSEKIVAQRAKLSFLVLPNIREMQPYNPSRLMRQFREKKTCPRGC